MRGLKHKSDLDDARFVRFFSLIQNKAMENGSVFFSWSGEGHEIMTDELDGEDMSGWLVPFDESDEFEIQWMSGLDAIGDKFDDMFVFARWREENGSIVIEFS